MTTSGCYKKENTRKSKTVQEKEEASHNEGRQDDIRRLNRMRKKKGKAIAEEK